MDAKIFIAIQFPNNLKIALCPLSYHVHLQFVKEIPPCNLYKLINDNDLNDLPESLIRWNWNN